MVISCQRKWFFCSPNARGMYLRVSIKRSRKSHSKSAFSHFKVRSFEAEELTVLIYGTSAHADLRGKLRNGNDYCEGTIPISRDEFQKWAVCPKNQVKFWQGRQIVWLSKQKSTQRVFSRIQEGSSVSWRLRDHSNKIRTWFFIKNIYLVCVSDFRACSVVTIEPEKTVWPTRYLFMFEKEKNSFYCSMGYSFFFAMNIIKVSSKQ